MCPVYGPEGDILDIADTQKKRKRRAAKMPQPKKRKLMARLHAGLRWQVCVL